MRESAVEAYLMAQVWARGGRTRKLKWLCRDGAPDRVVMFPGGRLFFVELKRPGATPRLVQRLEHEALTEMGQTVLVLDCKKAIDDFLATT